MGIDKNNNKCIVESMIDSPIDSGPREREREREILITVSLQYPRPSTY